MVPDVTQLAIIESWHRAVNASDAAAAGALCADDVEVGGPRGAARGRAVVVEWVDRAGVRLEPVRWFCGASGAVVEQDARWADAATGALSEPVRLATAFGVDGGRITRVLRHPDLRGALAVLGLTASDEVTGRGATR